MDGDRAGGCVYPGTMLASLPLPTCVAWKARIEHCPASCLRVAHEQKNLFFGRAVYRFATNYNGRSSEAA